MFLCILVFIRIPTYSGVHVYVGMYIPGYWDRIFFFLDVILHL